MLHSTSGVGIRTNQWEKVCRGQHLVSTRHKVKQQAEFAIEGRRFGRCCGGGPPAEISVTFGWDEVHDELKEEEEEDEDDDHDYEQAGKVRLMQQFGVRRSHELTCSRIRFFPHLIGGFFRVLWFVKHLSVSTIQCSHRALFTSLFFQSVPKVSNTWTKALWCHLTHSIYIESRFFIFLIESELKWTLAPNINRTIIYWQRPPHPIVVQVNWVDQTRCWCHHSLRRPIVRKRPIRLCPIQPHSSIVITTTFPTRVFHPTLLADLIRFGHPHILR